VKAYGYVTKSGSDVQMNAVRIVKLD
jgi:hypothetical protein